MRKLRLKELKETPKVTCEKGWHVSTGSLTPGPPNPIVQKWVTHGSKAGASGGRPARGWSLPDTAWHSRTVEFESDNTHFRALLEVVLRC